MPNLENISMKSLLELVMDGFGPFKSARAVAEEFMADRRYSSHEQRLDAVINWQSARSFAAGFLSNLGGAGSLPVKLIGIVPAVLIQIRLAAIIAILYGHDAACEKVQCMILLSIIGSEGGEILKKELIKKYGYQVAEKTIVQLVVGFPQFSMPFLVKAASKHALSVGLRTSVVNVKRSIPVIGGLIGGAVDFAGCKTFGYTANQLFSNLPAGG